METSQETASVFTPGQIAMAAFLGGPLPACLLAAHNAKVLRERGQRMMWMVTGILGTALALGLALFVLPQKFPPYILPIAYTVGIREAARNLQHTGIAEHLAAGGKTGSWWVAVGLALAGLVLIFAIVFALMQLFPAVLQ